MPTPNFNHFTGRTRPFNTRKRKKGKIKLKKNHKNKYEKYSLGKEPPTKAKK